MPVDGSTVQHSLGPQGGLQGEPPLLELELLDELELAADPPPVPSATVTQIPPTAPASGSWQTSPEQHVNTLSVAFATQGMPAGMQSP
jgi:hypothetical protein